MGIYTKNHLFYKPAYGASGLVEKNTFDAALDYADDYIHNLKLEVVYAEDRLDDQIQAWAGIKLEMEAYADEFSAAALLAIELESGMKIDGVVTSLSTLRAELRTYADLNSTSAVLAFNLKSAMILEGEEITTLATLKTTLETYADSGSAAAILSNDLESKMTINEVVVSLATLKETLETYADSGSAAASWIASLEVLHGTNLATLNSNLQTYADSGSAVATWRTNLETTHGTNLAALVTNLQAYADSQSMVASWRSSLEALHGTNLATLNSNLQTYADSQSAVAGWKTTLEASHGTNLVSITNNATAISDLDGNIKGEYVLSIDAGGRVTGFKLAITGDSPSEFTILSDVFKIVNWDVESDVIEPFIVSTVGGQGSKVGINGYLLVDGTIDAKRLKITGTDKIDADEIPEGAGNKYASESGADVTQTIIDGGLITTGIIQDKTPNPTLKIDFGNAKITVAAADGLVVDSEGGIRVNSSEGIKIKSGGGITVEDGGGIELAEGAGLTIAGAWSNYASIFFRTVGEEGYNFYLLSTNDLMFEPVVDGDGRVRFGTPSKRVEAFWITSSGELYTYVDSVDITTGPSGKPINFEVRDQYDILKFLTITENDVQIEFPLKFFFEGSANYMSITNASRSNNPPTTDQGYIEVKIKDGATVYTRYIQLYN